MDRKADGRGGVIQKAGAFNPITPKEHSSAERHQRPAVMGSFGGKRAPILPTMAPTLFYLINLKSLPEKNPLRWLARWLLLVVICILIIDALWHWPTHPYTYDGIDPPTTRTRQWYPIELLMDEKIIFVRNFIFCFIYLFTVSI